MTPVTASHSSGLFLAHTGSYPRIGDSTDLQTLRRTWNALDSGKAAPADVAAAEDDMTRRALSDQALAGLEYVTDGLIRWYDPISHLAGKLAGVEIHGLLRFFDTNFYFRQPVLKARPVRENPLLVREYEFARTALNHLPTPNHSRNQCVKAVLTGPYTLAKFSLGEADSMQSLPARAEAYANALAAEVADLAKTGAEFIQIDEPAILKYPGDWNVFEEALQPIVQVRRELLRRGGRLQLGLYVYFRDCVPLYERLVHLPFDVIGLDFTYNPSLVEMAAAKGSPRPLGLGLIDARNTRLEDPEIVARQIERMLPHIEGEVAYLGPSTGLEYLPRERARAKLGLLRQARTALFGAED